MEAIELQSTEAIRQHRQWMESRKRLYPAPPSLRISKKPETPAPIIRAEVSPPEINSTEFIRSVITSRVKLHPYKSMQFYRPEVSYNAWVLGTASLLKIPKGMGERRTCNFVLRMMAEAHGVCKSEILSNRKYEPVALARQTGIYIMRELLGLSYPVLGRLFNRHHASAIESVRVINARCIRDAGFAIQVAWYVELARQGRTEGFAVLDNIPVGNRRWWIDRRPRSKAIIAPARAAPPPG